MKNYKNMTKCELKAILECNSKKLKQIQVLEKDIEKFNSLTTEQKIILLDTKIDLKIEIENIKLLL